MAHGCFIISPGLTINRKCQFLTAHANERDFCHFGDMIYIVYDVVINILLMHECKLLSFNLCFLYQSLLRW